MKSYIGRTNGFDIEFHKCGSQSYYIAKRGSMVFTSKSKSYMLRKVRSYSCVYSTVTGKDLR